MTELGFVPPDLRALDEARAEVLVTSIYSDVRPFAGTAGLFDFRLAGRLSRLARQGFLTGDHGELFAMPVRSWLPVDKLIVVGLGAREAYDPTCFGVAFGRVLGALEGLSTKRALIELPGRQHARFDVEVAVDALLAWMEGGAPDELALVEREDGQARIEQRILERRRAMMRGQLA